MRNKSLKFKFFLFNIMFLSIFFWIKNAACGSNFQKIYIEENESSILNAEEIGGRGGKVFKIKNLNSIGDGSLSECLLYEKPRICVFEVSGYINIDNDLNIKNPYLTVAGQTAPSPGITIKGAGIKISTHDVIIEHLRFRLGDEKKEKVSGDAVAIIGDRDKIGTTKNIVLNHISASWAWDEILSTWSDNISNITISNSIISEGLDDSIHPKGKHSCGMLIGPKGKNIRVIKNLFAHNHNRNPYLKGLSSTAVINNIIYNPCYRAIQLEDLEGYGNIVASIIGNLLIAGIDTNKNLPFIQIKSDVLSAALYIHDNLMISENNKLGVLIENLSKNKIEINQIPNVDLSGLEILNSHKVFEMVLKNVGARPADRDEVDKRIINDVKNRTGNKINCVKADYSKKCDKNAGGWPELKNNYREIKIPSDSIINGNSDSSINIKDIIEQYSKRVLN